MNRPNIVISSLDADRLERLLDSFGKSGFPGRAELQEELDRADIVAPAEIPHDVVTMNSTVRFRVLSTEEAFQFTLVYPRDLDGSDGKISVLSPVGSALLGLKELDEIEWPVPGGKTVTVRIESVVYQPERAGQLHR